MKKLSLGLIRGYQYTLSPLLGQQCRFYPSCSHYAYEAIDQHGMVYGIYLGVRRLLRCHPFAPGGYDPVPPAHHGNPQSPQSHPSQHRNH